MNEHQDLRENIPALALGILEDKDAKVLQDHIAGCPACKAELNAMLDTVGYLGFGAPDVEPSTGLRDRILQKTGSQQRADIPAKVPWWQNLFGTRPVLSFVGLGLIVVLLVSNLLLWSQMWASDEGNFSVIRLSATEAMPQAQGMIVLSPDGRYGTLVVSDLADLGGDQQYQLWLIRGEDRSSGGVFSVSANGYGAMEIYSHEPLSSYESFGITIEPSGGSQGPTGDKVLGSS